MAGLRSSVFSVLRRGGRRRAGLALLSSYSRFVGLMKVALPATAAALLGLIFAWPHLVPQDTAFRLTFADMRIRPVDTLTMSSFRYYGTDDKNQPFTVTGDTASQLNSAEQIIALEKPVARISKQDGSTIVVSADTGFFHQKENTLDLLGHVDLYQDDGYEVHTSSARIDVKPGNAAGNELTRAVGPSGTVEGDGFRMWDHGDRIVFTGKTKALLNTARSKP